MPKIDKPIDAARNILNHGPNIAYPARNSAQYVRDVMAALLNEVEAQQQDNFRLVAESVRKFAPDLAEQLVARWHIAIKKDDDRLEAFLKVLREHQDKVS